MGDEIQDPEVEEVPTPVDALPEGAWQDEDWEKFLGEYYSGSSADTTPPPEGEPSADEVEVEPAASAAEAEHPSEPESGPAPAASEAPAPEGTPTAEDFIQIGSQRIPAEHADRVAAFWEWMNTYPQQAMEFMGYLNGEYTLTPAEAQAAAEAAAAEERAKSRQDENWDFVPESVKEAVTELDEVKQRLERYDAWVAQMEQQQVAAQVDQANQAVTMGIDAFRSDYDVSDEDMQQLRQDAAALGVADRLAQQYNDPVRAVKESLEIAYLRNPAFRDRETARQQDQARKDRERQSKLGALGGSGTAPAARLTTSTPEDNRAGMVRAIREAVNNG